MLNIVLVAIAVIIIAIILLGFVLPRSFSFTKEVFIAADKKAIFNTLDTFETWCQWSAWSKHNDEHIVITYDSKKSGVGAKMQWKGKKMGLGAMEIIQSDPYKMLEISVLFNKGLFKFIYVFFLEEQSNGVKIIWQAMGKTKRSGIAKLLAKTFNKWMKKDMEIALKILKTTFES